MLIFAGFLNKTPLPTAGRFPQDLKRLGYKSPLKAKPKKPERLEKIN